MSSSSVGGNSNSNNIDPDVRRHADQLMDEKLDELGRTYYQDLDSGEWKRISDSTVAWADAKFRDINAQLYSDQVKKAQISLPEAMQKREACLARLRTLALPGVSRGAAIEALNAIQADLRSLKFYSEARDEIRQQIRNFVAGHRATVQRWKNEIDGLLRNPPGGAFDFHAADEAEDVLVAWLRGSI